MSGVKMPKKKKHFSKNERLILRVLHSERAPLTIRKIAEKSGLSWTTTRKYLRILVQKGWVKERVNGYEEKKER